MTNWSNEATVIYTGRSPKAKCDMCGVKKIVVIALPAPEDDLWVCRQCLSKAIEMIDKRDRRREMPTITKVRAKFVCEKVAPIGGGVTDESTRRVIMSAVTTGSKENEQFWKYTPAGSLEMQIDNLPAAELFVEGKEYYLDFTLAEAATEGCGAGISCDNLDGMC